MPESDFFAPHSPTTRYKWVIRDMYACPDCRHLNGQIMPLQRWWFLGTPGLHPNCHCSLIPVEDKDDYVLSDSHLWLLLQSRLLYFNLDGSITDVPNDAGPAILDPRPPDYDV